MVRIHLCPPFLKKTPQGVFFIANIKFCCFNRQLSYINGFYIYMKVNLSNFKKYCRTPIMKNCWRCSKVKPMYTLDRDVFVAAQKAAQEFPRIRVSVTLPTEKTTFAASQRINLNEKQNIILESLKNADEKLVLEYNPLNIGTVLQKVGKRKKQPLEVAVLRSTNKAATSYYFMTKDLKEQVGFLKITDPQLLKKISRKDFNDELKGFYLLDDFPEYGVKGKRILVDYLKNQNEEKYSGIGVLADRICVEYCMQRKMKPMIVSESVMGNGREGAPHIAHYKRGKRFLPLRDKAAKEVFIEEYGEVDTNKVIEKLLETKKGKWTDTADWGLAPMYLPENKIREYMKMAKNEPILHDG